MTDNRYSRQILFPAVGAAGQDMISRARVAVIGAGALGCSHIDSMARAGVGHLRIIDRDFVEFSNLQRQTLYRESDAKERLPKAVAARTRVAEINSEIDIEAIVADVTRSNVESLIANADIVLDGTDNFLIRYILNDACIKHGRDWIYGAAVSSYGTTMTVRPGVTPCLRCIFEEIPDAGSSPTCDTAGVIMPIVSSISAIQVSEALKLIVGDTGALHSSIIQVDVWNNEYRMIRDPKRNPDCPACGNQRFEFLDAESEEFAAVLCGRNAVQISPSRETSLDLQKFADGLRQVATVQVNEYLARFEIDGHELTVFRDARAIIKGTDDIPAARSLYARYVGT